MTTIDLTETIAPKSDQMNSDDLMSGPRTFTISSVHMSGSADQPVSIVLAEFPAARPFKPSKSMRRIMVMAWGKDGSAYVGRRLTLFRDPSITFAGQAVGGIRISAMSDIEDRLQVALTMTRGKRAPYRVDVLAKDAPTSSPAVSPKILGDLNKLFDRKGVAEDARLSEANTITGGSATAFEVLTEDEARQVWRTINNRPDTTAAPTDLARQQQAAAQASWEQE